MQVMVTKAFSQLIDNILVEKRKYYEKRLMDYIEKYGKMLQAGQFDKVVSTMHQDVDEALEKAETASEAFCKEGCSSCCNMRVATPAPEALHIIMHCRKHDIVPDFEMMKQQISHFPEDGDGDQFYQRVPLEYRRCMFLKDNKCSIYEVRPISCRLHFMHKDSPVSCEQAMVTNELVPTVHALLPEAILCAFLNVTGSGGAHMAHAIYSEIVAMNTKMKAAEPPPNAAEPPPDMEVPT